MPPIRMTPAGSLALALTLGPIACGDDGPAPTGAVEVTTVSTGQGLDTDGYVVELEGADPLAIGVNATATLGEVPAGDLEIRLTGLRGNCAVQGPHPRILRVAAGETFRTRFEVSCADTPLLGRIVFSSDRDGNSEIYSVNPDGSGLVRITNTPDEDEVYPAVSPDGSRILFINRVGPEPDVYDASIWVMNADGTGRVSLADTAGFYGPVAWSPDGARIAFSAALGDDGEAYEIWRMNADGSALVNLTNTPDIGEGLPAWSPDGRILFTTGDGETPHLAVMNADGSGQARLGEDLTHSGTWSPDGSRIAFLFYQNERDRLFTMGADGADPVTLTGDDGSSDSFASWSPEGGRLAFINYAVGGAVELYVINADGSGAVNITDNADYEGIGLQAWGP